MKICKFCNKEFIELKNRKQFCSRYCAVRAASKISTEKYKNGLFISCITCGKEKYLPMSAVNTGKRHYCSIKCRRNGAEFKCKICDKIFHVPQYRIKKGKAKYCSRNCLAKDLLGKYHNKFGFQPSNKPKHVYKCLRINGKSVREHRYLMEQSLGRKLEFWEHVHHIDGNSSNNNIENLVVLSNTDHQREEYKIRKKITSSASA